MRGLSFPIYKNSSILTAGGFSTDAGGNTVCQRESFSAFLCLIYDNDKY